MIPFDYGRAEGTKEPIGRETRNQWNKSKAGKTNAMQSGYSGKNVLMRRITHHGVSRQEDESMQTAASISINIGHGSGTELSDFKTFSMS